MRLRRFTLFLVLFICSINIYGQEKKSGVWQIDTNFFIIDSLSCYPNSFQLTGISENDYTFNWITSSLIITNEKVIGKTVFYSYTTFSINLSKKKQHKSTDLIFEKGTVYKPEVTPQPTQSWWAKDDATSLYATGSIARGVTIGNNQDFVLTSALNLQLSGFLAKDLEIQANITDKNVPIQPEGNTRVIQDFDKIFIHLNYKNQWMLKGGDLDIAKPSGYFLVANRRLLGMEAIAQNFLKKDSSLSMRNSVGGGVAKGKFVRHKLNVSNGLQGPYKLTGNSGQGNIVIISASERVYLDNSLLTRGLDQDYVMDYNTGEITFTSKILVATEKEFNIEYQYTDLAYSRFALFAYNEFKSEKSSKLNLRVNFFHEQDQKNRSIQPQLTDSMKLFLSEIGDNPYSYFPNVDTSSFYPNEILYQKIDSLSNDEIYTIYKYCTDQNLTLYRLGFTFMGYSKGNYVLQVSQTNGRIFAWVAPLNGIPQGNYEPVVLLSTPTLQQMGTIGMDWFINKNTGFSTEFAFSNYDKNTFSNVNNKDNAGFAYQLDFFHKNKLKKSKNKEKPWWFFTKLGGEYHHQNFHAIESFRSVEFYKDYNLPTDYSENLEELLVFAEAGFNQVDIGGSDYTFTYYKRGKNAQSFRNELNSITTAKGFRFSTQNSFLLTNDSLQKTNYFRTFNQFSKTFKKVELGIFERFEYNNFQNSVYKELLSNSFRFNEAYIYIKNNDSIAYKYNVMFKHLLTDKPFLNNFERDNYSYEAMGEFEITKLKNNTFKGTATFRNTHQRDSARKFFAENFFIGSIEYTGRFFRNALFINTYYNAGSGLEQKKLFSYLKVADGQGNYQWIDYNQNGIEEMDEFEIAAFQDKANYIKVWSTSPEYINTFNNQFTQVIQLRPSNVWSNKKGFRKFLSRFSDAATLRIGQKNSAKNIAVALNPFQFNLSDSTLINSQVNFNNNFSFNQLSSIWGIDYIYRYTQNKNLIYYGMETNTMNWNEVIVRWKPHKNITLKANYIYYNKNNFSEYFSSRDYQILNHSVANSIQGQHQNKIFWGLIYTYKNKANQIGIEKMQQHDAVAEFSYRFTNRGNLSAKVQYSYINYYPKNNNYNSQTAVSYELLEGLQNGNNALWNLSFQTNITQFLQLDLRYEGRVSENNKAVHTGLMQIKAFF